MFDHGDHGAGVGWLERDVDRGDPVGIVDRLPESSLDAFTGVAGSGPAYVFLVAESLVDAAVAGRTPAELRDELDAYDWRRTSR